MAKTYAIGKRIKARREEIGLTQEQLSNLLGYKSKSAICKIETCRGDVAQSKMLAFAKALHTTPEYLLGLTEDSRVIVSEETNAKIDQELVDILEHLDKEKYAMLLAYAKLLDKS